MKVALLLVLCVVAIADKSCNLSQPPNGNDSTVNTSQPPPEDGTAEVNGSRTALPGKPCQPFTAYLYEDVSGSVDKPHMRMAKQAFINQLKQNRATCIEKIKIQQFGTGSVWSTQARGFQIPVRPYCSPEPDYNQLPPAVRNFEPWREKLRKQHTATCAEAEKEFLTKYDVALAEFEQGLLFNELKKSNGCTSFGNLFARIRLDLENDPNGRIILLSDLKWTCDEKLPAPIAARGVIIQIIGEQTDDTYRYSSKMAEKFIKVLPECEVIPEVKAEYALTALFQQTTQQIVTSR